jgi:hypothetical protein
MDAEFIEVIVVTSEKLKQIEERENQEPLYTEIGEWPQSLRWVKVSEVVREGAHEGKAQQEVHDIRKTGAQ